MSPRDQNKTLLSIDHISASYGRVVALRDVSLTVLEGEAVALIGANGAGKSTLFKTIIGFLQPRGGGLSFRGRAVAALPPEKRVQLGIGYAPEGRRVFPGLSVRENLEVASLGRRAQREELLGQVLEMFPQLAERQAARGWQLSGGQQQMLAIRRGFMSGPKLLVPGDT